MGSIEYYLGGRLPEMSVQISWRGITHVLYIPEDEY